MATNDSVLSRNSFEANGDLAIHSVKWNKKQDDKRNKVAFPISKRQSSERLL